MVVTSDDNDPSSWGGSARGRRQRCNEPFLCLGLVSDVILPNSKQPVRKSLINGPEWRVSIGVMECALKRTHESRAEGAPLYRPILQHKRRWKYARTIGLQWSK